MNYLRVVNPSLLNTVCGINNTMVRFDANGVSEPLSEADYATACSIPAFIPLSDDPNALSAYEQETFLAVPEVEEGQAPAPDETSDDSGQELPEHDEDRTLYEQFLAEPNGLDWFAALPLLQRLDLASDHRLTEVQAAAMFTGEGGGKNSKRVLAALDRRLQLLRQTKTAGAVTTALLQANFPVQEEQ